MCCLWWTQCRYPALHSRSRWRGRTVRHCSRRHSRCAGTHPCSAGGCVHTVFHSVDANRIVPICRTPIHAQLQNLPSSSSLPYTHAQLARISAPVTASETAAAAAEHTPLQPPGSPPFNKEAFTCLPPVARAVAARDRLDRALSGALLGRLCCAMSTKVCAAYISQLQLNAINMLHWTCGMHVQARCRRWRQCRRPCMALQRVLQELQPLRQLPRRAQPAMLSSVQTCLRRCSHCCKPCRSRRRS